MEILQDMLKLVLKKFCKTLSAFKVNNTISM